MSVKQDPAKVAQGRPATYRATYRGVSRFFVTRKEAVAWEAAQKVAHAKGARIEPRSTRPKMRPFAEAFADARRSDATRKSYRSTLGHFLPAFGDQAIADIETTEIEGWVHNLPLGDETKGLCLTHVSAIFARAVDQGIRPTNPCKGVTRPRSQTTRERVRVIETETIWALADAIRPNRRAVVILGAFAGLRIGEICGLRIGDLDRDRGVIRVRRQIVWATEAKAIEVRRPKSDAGIRDVRVSGWVLDEIEAHAKAHGLGPEGEIVHDRGRRVRPHSVGLLFARLCRANGLAFSAHDLRHSFASIMLADRVSIPRLAQAMGHDNQTVTLRTYSHLMPGDDEAMVAALDRVQARRSSIRLLHSA